jgi:hypothetical protein
MTACFSPAPRASHPALCRQHPPRDRLRDGLILESQGTGSRLCRFFMAS